jgi:chloramphenicol-sensitive protein RarD
MEQIGSPSLGRGIINAVIAYLLWGVLPLYWKLLTFINPLQILAFRILFSLIFVGALLWFKRNTSWLNLLRDPKKRGFTLVSALVISFNWGLFIWAVNTGHTIETSLGYYINPLISILLGLIFFRERLTSLQWLAFGLAGLGVAILTYFSGTFPWVSLLLALSFGLYGLFKKKNNAGSLEALAAETLAVVPLAVLLLLCSPWFFPPGGNGIAAASPQGWIALALCGVVTAVPLYYFAQGAKLLPLSALGFTQFISPTLQFFIGVFVFGEAFPIRSLAAFGFIWLSVILYSVSLMRRQK